MNPIPFVLGFIFNATLTKVLLIHKNRPNWQKGHINGLGGKIEGKETPFEAIKREIQEECSLIISKDLWIKIGKLESNQSNVHVLASVYKGSLADAKTITDEKVEWFDINNLPPNINTNLSWLIPLCLDKMNDQELQEVKAYYGPTN